MRTYLDQRITIKESAKATIAANMLKNNQPKKCLEFINSIKLELLDSRNLANLHCNKGRALEKLNNYPEAFNQFRQMNQIQLKLFENAKKKRSEIEDRFNSKPSSVIIKPETSLNISFLVGFPRSGTTLLENILDSQSNVLALQEKPIIGKTEVEAFSFGMQKSGDVSLLNSESLLHLRAFYLKTLKAYARTDNLLEYDAIIDKQPMNILQLPLIKAIFPEAKIILALRHPLDCILSCYVQNFSGNKEMSHFTDWQHCFNRYNDVFNLYNYYKNTINFNCHVTRYEDVLSNFDIETKNLFNFINIPYDQNSARNFHVSAGTKLITSASKGQVNKKLYTTSKKRWLNYQEFIQPHIEIVKKHILRFGYDI